MAAQNTRNANADNVKQSGLLRQFLQFNLGGKSALSMLLVLQIKIKGKEISLSLAYC